MARPNNRYRRMEYDYIATMQGGEFCKICNYRPETPYSLHIDHINNNRDDNRPQNKQLLCDIDNAIKEQQRRKSERDGVKIGGEGSQNPERASAVVPAVASANFDAKEQTRTDAEAVMFSEDRKESRTSAESKNEDNQPLCEQIIKTEWNRRTDAKGPDGKNYPTDGLVYPRCVNELARRIREITGSGSQAAVRRYIKMLTSDGADWKISEVTKRIVPTNFSEYDPDREATPEEIAAGHRRITQIQAEELKRKYAEIEKLKAQLAATQKALPVVIPAETTKEVSEA